MSLGILDWTFLILGLLVIVLFIYRQARSKRNEQNKD